MSGSGSIGEPAQLFGTGQEGFTTRPVVAGRKGVVTAGHYLAAVAGMAVLFRGSFFSPGYSIDFAEINQAKSPIKLGENVTPNHFSYAMLRIDHPRATGRRHEWSATNNSRAPIMSDRNLGKDARYDQILHLPSVKDRFSNSGGTLDFFVDDDSIEELFPNYGYDRASFSYQLSDHFPIWVQIKTDIDGERLQQIVQNNRKS